MAATATIKLIKIITDDALGRVLIPGMYNLGNALGRRMQRLVPKRTWSLHDTIKNYGTEQRGSLVRVTVGFGGIAPNGRRVDYGLYVERGTSKMAAQPFARPALYQTKPADLFAEQDLDKPRAL